jgi:hypothetical protein
MSHETVTSSSRIAAFTPSEPRLAVVSDVKSTQLGLLHNNDGPTLIIPNGEVVILVGWATFKLDPNSLNRQEGAYPVVIARGRYGWLYHNEVEEIQAEE